MKPRFKGGLGRNRAGLATMVLFLALLVLPILAIVRLLRSYDMRVVLGYVAFISAFTYFIYWRDKRRAENGEWRIAEANLHFAELLGGWPGAFVAQRGLRHKIAKTGYQVKFWCIVALHQFAAFDFIHDWEFSRKAFRFVAQLAHRSGEL